MIHSAKWIWLDEKKYKDYQKTPISLFDPYSTDCKFAVAEFKKKVEFEKKIQEIKIEISGDVKFWLYVNDTYVGTGPVGAGGDYEINRPMPVQYYNTYVVKPDTAFVEFYVMVQNVPSVLCDMSQGKNGLILAAKCIMEDGSEEMVYSDSSWLSRRNNSYLSQNKVDLTLCSDRWNYAEETEPVWNLKKTDILMLEEEEIIPEDFVPFSVAPGEMKEVVCEFDKIYSIYHYLEVEAYGEYTILIRDFERDFQKNVNLTDTITGNSSVKFRGISMVSSGGMKLFVYNGGEKPLRVNKAAGLFIHYPIMNEGYFHCSDEVFNKIFRMGRHALKICRQSIELDSPWHQENLGCCGDYYIASLMNFFTDGDTKLTRLDIVRIADCLKLYEGYMFHTTYSMIWLMMVYDYYLFSGDISIFSEISEAIELLMEKMHSYAGTDEIINDPPSYMFVDWLVVDGISLHHPPAALGQAVLNAFYFGGLNMAAKLMGIMEKYDMQKRYHDRAAVLQKSFQENFYDAEKGLYFDGHNFKHWSGKWMQPNTDKRYFSWHTNVIAVLYDLAPKEKQIQIMETILNDMTLINPQPYFMHFVLEAVYKTGLFEKYGIRQLRRWEVMTDFEKGLQEGWYDMSGYGFDYSHVWAGTPTYQLPSKLSGLQILEPGFKKISLSPALYGLEFAEMEIPTPYGKIEIRMEQGKEPVIKIPEGISVVERKDFI